MIPGELVGLRAREPEDAALFHAWNSDPETMLWWDRTYPPVPVPLQEERLRTVPSPSFDEPSFTITDLATGTAIGWCGLHHVSAEHRHAELGVMIGDAAYRGRGYGSDATRTLCRFAFDRMNLARVTLVVFAANAAARRAYEKAGFVEEGVQRRAAWKRGEWLDLVHMAVFTETLR
ncbi:MAG TPA: GNAT family protein [Frankiaceae bacterium]|nr:GNAT family protein [Frankiaceae bacterium]